MQRPGHECTAVGWGVGVGVGMGVTLCDDACSWWSMICMLDDAARKLCQIAFLALRCQPLRAPHFLCARVTYRPSQESEIHDYCRSAAKDVDGDLAGILVDRYSVVARLFCRGAVHLPSPLGRVPCRAPSQTRKIRGFTRICWECRPRP